MDSSDLLNNSNVSSSTFNADETLTFYEDKYVPEYMSTKSTAENLVSKPLEYFEDSDQMVYARVKLWSRQVGFLFMYRLGSNSLNLIFFSLLNYLN